MVPGSRWLTVPGGSQFPVVPGSRVLLVTSSVEVSEISTVSVVVSDTELVSSAILDIRMSKRGSVSNPTDSVVI